MQRVNHNTVAASLVPPPDIRAKKRGAVYPKTAPHLAFCFIVTPISLYGRKFLFDMRWIVLSLGRIASENYEKNDFFSDFFSAGPPT